MDRRTLSERLPGDRIKRRLPVGRPGEDDEADGSDADDDRPSIDDVVPGTEYEFTSEREGSGRSTVKLALLALAGLGAVVTLVAVIARFVVDRGDDEADEGNERADTVSEHAAVSGAEPATDADEEFEPEADEPETVGDDSPGISEGTAAAIGLAFLLAVGAVRQWLDSPTA